jgi:hypothetical protein
MTKSVDRTMVIVGAVALVVSIPLLANADFSWFGVILALGGVMMIISSFAWARARAKGRIDSNDRPIVHIEHWAQWPISQADRSYVVGNDNAAANEIWFGRYGPQWAGEPSVRLGNGKLTVVKMSQIPFSERSVMRFEYEGRRSGAAVGTYTPLDLIFLVALIVQLFSPPPIYEIRVPIPIGREAEAAELVNRYNALLRG